MTAPGAAEGHLVEAGNATGIVVVLACSPSAQAASLAGHASFAKPQESAKRRIADSGRPSQLRCLPAGGTQIGYFGDKLSANTSEWALRRW